MLQNNGARLNIWKELSNPFDYQGFVDKCAEKSIVPMTNVDFAQKVGMLLSAKGLYPDLPLEQAYVMFVQENMGAGASQAKAGIISVKPNGNTIYKETNNISNDIIDMVSKSTCCGGGKVR